MLGYQIDRGEFGITNIDFQLERMQNHFGDKSLAVSMRGFLN